MKIGFCVALLSLSPAQTERSLPRVRGAEVVELGVTANLERDFDAFTERASGRVWAGYTVPMAPGAHSSCCGRGCRLDEGLTDPDRGATGGLEAGELYVLFRVARGRVEEVRVASGECELLPGRFEIYWWNAVSAEQSLDLLERLAREHETADLGEAALHAIAGHGLDRADTLLAQLASASSPRDLREKAVFWLGSARGERGFDELEELFSAEPSPDVKEKMVFAFHVSEAREATRKLIEIARRDEDAVIRERALFWLAQKASEEAVAAIRSSVTEDPELDVKKKAVFALSQLPPERGVPLLIQIAETHPEPAVREKAFFWLGQSGDERVLALLERVLLER